MRAKGTRTPSIVATCAHCGQPIRLIADTIRRPDEPQLWLHLRGGDLLCSRGAELWASPHAAKGAPSPSCAWNGSPVRCAEAAVAFALEPGERLGRFVCVDHRRTALRAAWAVYEVHTTKGDT